MREIPDETLLARLRRDGIVDLMALKEVERRGLMDAAEEMRRNRLAPAAALERVRTRKRMAKRRREAFRVRVEGERRELRKRLVDAWRDECASIDIAEASGRLRSAQAAYRRAWVGFGGSDEDLLRQAVAEERASVRRAQYAELSEALISRFPFRTNRRYAAYCGNLSPNNTTMSGAVHLVAAEPIRVGRYRRAVGQTLAGKHASDFHELGPVPDGHRGDLVSAADMEVLSRMLDLLGR